MSQKIEARERRVTRSKHAADGAAESRIRRLDRNKHHAVCQCRVALLLSVRVGI